MSDSLPLLYLTDAEDRVQAVQIPWDLWQKIEPWPAPCCGPFLPRPPLNL